MSLFSRNAQSGSVGILAVIVLALLGVVGAGMVNRTSTEARMAAGYRDGVAAQYLAEAGAQWAIAQIKADPAYKTVGAVSVSINSGSYKVKVEDITSSSNKRIISTGKIHSSSRTVVLVVTPASGGNEMARATTSHENATMPPLELMDATKTPFTVISYNNHL